VAASAPAYLEAQTIDLIGEIVVLDDYVLGRPREAILRAPQAQVAAIAKRIARYGPRVDADRAPTSFYHVTAELAFRMLPRL